MKMQQLVARSLSRVAPGLLLLGLLGCTTPAEPLKISISEGDRSLLEGRTLLLTAVVGGAGPGDPSVSWSSDDPSVLAVEAFGSAAIVTGVAPGSANVSARLSQVPETADSVRVTVDATGVLLWGVQFGTFGADVPRGVALDPAGNIFVAGGTTGIWSGGGGPVGEEDAFVMKLDGDGGALWTKQFGSDGFDKAVAIAADEEGGAVAVGYVGELLEDKHLGMRDAFVRRYAADGSVLWTQQFGTEFDDSALGVAIDGDGAVFVAGSTGGLLGETHAGRSDGFLRRYTPDGKPSWTEQFGTDASDAANVVAVTDSGTIVVAGSTAGALEGANLGSDDGFVMLFGSDGTLLWVRQFGITATDEVRGVAVAGGSIYLSGRTFGLAPSDMFVRAYDLDGGYLWTRLFGSDDYDEGQGLAVGFGGSVHVTGNTYADSDGDSMANDDAYVRTYDPHGEVRWMRHIGTEESEVGYAVATDAAGRVAVVGTTRGELHAGPAGGDDVFLRVYGP